MDKKFILNLNNYRNTYYMTLNQAKVAFKDEVWASVVGKNGTLNKPTPPLSFNYTLYPKTARKCDLGNVLSIVQKFTDDALTELGIIPDDNYEVINTVSYTIGHVDRDNPRVELEIRELRAA